MQNSAEQANLQPFESPLPHQCFSPVSLELPEGLSESAWSGIGPELLNWREGLQWHLGDWLLYGEKHFGERAYQALDALNYRLNTLQMATWVCERIPPERRRNDRVEREQLADWRITFSHHRMVAPLDNPEAQDQWLQKAIDGQWSVKELYANIHPDDGASALEGVSEAVVPVSVLRQLRAVSEGKIGLLWRLEDHRRLLALLDFDE